MMGRDLLGIEDLERADLERILETAERMQEVGRRDVKKVPTLRGRTLVNLFFESSTRTRTSFEIAGKRLSADVVNFSPSSSSLTKAESILDTAMTLDAMDPDAVIVRHKVAGVPKRIADALAAPVINAGDGAHEHPTQALLDCFTAKQEKGRFDGLTVTIIGDITHSRVARSNLYAFSKLGAEVRLAAPPTMLPAGVESLGAKAYTSLREALEGADVVMVLRIQQERLDGCFFEVVGGQVRHQVANEEQTGAVVVGREMGDAGAGIVGHGPAKIFLGDLFVSHRLDHVGPGHEHVRSVLHHQVEVGDGGRVDGTTGARAEDRGDLRNDA